MILWSELSKTPLPNDWNFLVLEEVCGGIFDCPHSTPKLVNEGCHLVRTPDIITGKLELSNTNKVSSSTYKERIKRAVPEAGDLLFSREGTYFGIAATIPEKVELCLGQRMVLLKLLSNYIPNFIKYWINSPIIKQYLHSSREGSVAERLNMSTIRQIPVAAPTHPEQKAIATILSSLDDKIDLLHRQNKTFRTMAETLFRQWFIEEAQEDWETGKLGDFVTISYGKNLPTKNLLRDGYPVFGANGQIGFFNKFLYEEPQVLVSCRGEASGTVNISSHNSFVTNNSLILERNKREEITFEYLKYYSLTYNFKLHVSGSAQPQITIDGLFDGDFYLPHKARIIEFSNIVRMWEKKRTINNHQIKTLEKLRDNLLPKLMSGEFRIQFDSKAAL